MRYHQRTVMRHWGSSQALRQDHGQKTTSSASKSVSDIVVLGDCLGLRRRADFDLVRSDLDLCHRRIDLRSGLLFGVV